jgi:hypothetical protein
VIKFYYLITDIVPFKVFFLMNIVASLHAQPVVASPQKWALATAGHPGMKGRVNPPDFLARQPTCSGPGGIMGI